MKKLTLTTLGGITATVDCRLPVQFRTDKVRALLVYLALEGERPHQRSSLAALLWPEMPEQTALKNLRQSLHLLQQTLDAQSPGLSGLLFTVTRQTVQGNSALSDVDALSFQRLLDGCERHDHRHLHLCHDCLNGLREAVALYRGELLAGFSLPDAIAFEEWLLLWRERLQQRAINALGRLAAALAERGDIEPALVYAGRQLSLDPFDEEGHRLAMRLLARDGKHGNAMAHYERCRRLLEEELGVEPAQETTALYQRIRAEQRRGPERVRAKAATRHHFPAQFTPFIGRERELAEIEELFRDPERRLLTLIGPGGIGKSRLSVQASERLSARSNLADDIYFLPVAAVQTTDALLATLLAGLGVALSARSQPHESLIDYLRPRRCLLILDNFEQLVGSASLLAEMLAAAPGLRLLVTSQHPLNVRAERQVRVQGLDYPAHDGPGDTPLASSAVRLFVASARQVDSSFQLTPDNQTAVLQICRLVEGMPLGLELAAAWVRVMDCAAIEQEISRGVDFLSLAPQDKPDRHQSMEAIFAYAWELLPSPDRTVLGELAVFRGPFSLEAARAVANAAPLALARLLERSLLQRREDGHYELHGLLRQFVVQATIGQEQPAARRHCAYYLELVAAQERAFYGPQPRRAVAAVQPYLGNLRQAWEWAITHKEWPVVARSLEAMGRFFYTATLLQEGEAMFARAIDGLGESAFLLTWHAFFLEKQGRNGDAARLARLALDHARDDGERAEASSLLGKLLAHEGRMEEAKSFQQQAIDYYRASAELELLARALRRMGILCFRAAQYDQALTAFQQSIPLHKALEHKAGLAQLYSAMGGVYWERRDVTQALAYLQQARELFEAIDDQLGVASSASNLAILYKHLGAYEESLAANQQAIEISQVHGDRYSLSIYSSGRARTLLEMGAFERSLDYFYRALEIEKELGNEWGIAYHQAGIASVYHHKGEFDTALSHYDLALPALLAQGAPYYAIEPLLSKAELLYKRGDWSASRALCEQGQAMAAEADLSEWIERGRALAAALCAAGAGEGA